MEDGQIVIVVASAGWVFVGETVAQQDERHLVLRRASTIRAWGTTRGLGELARGGPLSGTTLDPVGVVLLEKPTHVLFRIPCDNAAWKKKLP